MKHSLDKHKRKENNLVDITLEKLISLGYKQRKFTEKLKYKEEPYCQEGDLLCAVNKEKNLWIILDSKSAKSIDPAKFLVYYK